MEIELSDEGRIKLICLYIDDEKQYFCFRQRSFFLFFFFLINSPMHSLNPSKHIERRRILVELKNYLLVTVFNYIEGFEYLNR